MEQLLTENILEVADQIQKEKDKSLSSLKLTSGHDRFLLCLLYQDGMNMGAISDSIGAKPPSTAKFAAKLEQQGYIRRESSALDSRQQHAFLTEEGRKVAEELEVHFKKIDKKYRKKISTKKQDRLMLLLKLLQTNQSKEKPAALKPKKAGKSVKDAIKIKDKKRKKKKD